MDKQKEFLDKVLERLLKDTVITDSKITFPFAIFKQEELTGDSLLSVSIWMDGRWENHKYPSRFNDYCNNIYGLTYEESVILWRRYMEIIEKEVLNRLRRNKSNVATTWNLGRHDINESVDKQKEYLDKVVDQMVSETEVSDRKTILGNVLIMTPFYDAVFTDDRFTDVSSELQNPTTIFFPINELTHNFSSHVENIYGLYKKEVLYTLKKYIDTILLKINGRY